MTDGCGRREVLLDWKRGRLWMVCESDAFSFFEDAEVGWL